MADFQLPKSLIYFKISTNTVKPMNCIKKQHPLSLAVVSNGQQDSSSLSAVFLNKNKHLVHFFGISHKKTKNSHQNVSKSRPSGSTLKHFDSNFQFSYLKFQKNSPNVCFCFGKQLTTLSCRVVHFLQQLGSRKVAFLHGCQENKVFFKYFKIYYYPGKNCQLKICQKFFVTKFLSYSTTYIKFLYFQLYLQLRNIVQNIFDIFLTDNFFPDNNRI